MWAPLDLEEGTISSCLCVLSPCLCLFYIKSSCQSSFLLTCCIAWHRGPLSSRGLCLLGFQDTVLSFFPSSSSSFTVSSRHGWHAPGSSPSLASVFCVFPLLVIFLWLRVFYLIQGPVTHKFTFLTWSLSLKFRLPCWYVSMSLSTLF